MRRTLALTVCLTLAAHGTAMAQQEAARPPAASLNPLSGLTLESLEATRALPLFTPSRTAPYVPPPAPVVAFVPPPPPPPPPPTPPPLDLVGIVTTGSTEFALLRDRGTGEMHRLSAGEDYDGWSIEFVDARSVAFHNGDQTETLTMFGQFDALPNAGMPNSAEFPNLYPPYTAE